MIYNELFIVGKNKFDNAVSSVITISSMFNYKRISKKNVVIEFSY